MVAINLEMLRELLAEFTEKETVLREEKDIIEQQILELDARIASNQKKLDSLNGDRSKVDAMRERYLSGNWKVEVSAEAAAAAAATASVTAAAEAEEEPEVVEAPSAKESKKSKAKEAKELLNRLLGDLIKSKENAPSLKRTGPKLQIKPLDGALTRF